MKDKLPAKMRAYFRKIGRAGGKRSLETMTQEQRTARAKTAVTARIAKSASIQNVPLDTRNDS